MRISTNLLSSKLETLSFRIRQSSSTGKWHEVLSHYHEIHRTGVQFNDPSLFHIILKACTNLSSATNGKSIHANLFKHGFDSFSSTGNSIMDFYVKNRDLDSAFRVFDSLSYKDSVSWNIMVYAHIDQGFLQKGLLWFSSAVVSTFFEPNVSTLVVVIQACRATGDCFKRYEIHGYVIRNGFFEIVSVQNSLLSMYSEVDMKYARNLFDKMPEKDVVSWSVMIGAYVQSGEPLFGLNLFKEMVSTAEIEPDGVTVVSVLKACTVVEDINMGKLVHGFVIYRGFSDDLFIDNSLIDMYSKCNDTDSAFQIFDEMACKNIISWNSMLSGLVHNHKFYEASSLFCLMTEKGVKVDEVTLVSILQVCKYLANQLPCKSIHSVIIRHGYKSNELVLNSLIHAYAKCNLDESASKLFDQMNTRDVVSWSTMISGYTHCGKPDKAIAIFNKMSQEDLRPNSVTIINLLEACSLSAEITRSKCAHAITIRGGMGADVAVRTATIDMYSKCGDIESAKRVFNQIQQKTTISWSAMIAAYGTNGRASEALASFAEMKQSGIHPNGVTTLSVLSACSHGGLIEQGIGFFKSMVENHSVEPGFEHYSCMVDILSRAGELDAAIELISNLPKGMKPGATAWGSILSGCRSHHNSELGEGAARHFLELEPLCSSGYILASSIYATENLWEKASRIRKLVKEKNVKVVGGYSLVHIGNKGCRFLAGDRSNSGTNWVVEQLHSCMKIKKCDNFECVQSC